MSDVWKCPNGHFNSFRVTEYSPDINCILSDDTPCEECGIEFDPETWKHVELSVDDPF